MLLLVINDRRESFEAERKTENTLQFNSAFFFCAKNFITYYNFVSKNQMRYKVCYQPKKEYPPTVKAIKLLKQH